MAIAASRLRWSTPGSRCLRQQLVERYIIASSVQAIALAGSRRACCCGSRVRCGVTFAVLLRQQARGGVTLSCAVAAAVTLRRRRRLLSRQQGWCGIRSLHLDRSTGATPTCARGGVASGGVHRTSSCIGLSTCPVVPHTAMGQRRSMWERQRQWCQPQPGAQRQRQRRGTSRRVQREFSRRNAS